jgi:hypothetical protein
MEDRFDLRLQTRSHHGLRYPIPHGGDGGFILPLLLLRLGF